MKDTTTLWIPFGDGRAARVRIDVLSPALPAPLEVEDAAVPDEDDMARILAGLANGEWQTEPPFDAGLPPATLGDALGPVSEHAQARGKERAGLDRSALERTAAKALSDGVRPRETKGRLRRYLDKISAEHGTRPRIHGQHIYIFGRADCLVTVLELPHEFRQAAASALNKRSR